MKAIIPVIRTIFYKKEFLFFHRRYRKFIPCLHSKKTENLFPSIFVSFIIFSIHLLSLRAIMRRTNNNTCESERIKAKAEV